jgi:hypothetical protein
MSNEIKLSVHRKPCLTAREAMRSSRSADGFETAGVRCGAWALSLMSRHGLVFARRDTPAMVLLQRLPLLRLLHERRTVMSQQFRPQLNLSLNAFFGQTLRRERQYFIPERRLRASPVMAEPVRVELSVSPVVQTVKAERVAESKKTNDRHVAAPSFAAAQTQAPAQLRQIKQLLPLQLVLQRRNQLEELKRVYRQSSVTRESVLTFTERVVRQRHRIEERASKQVAFVTRRAAVPAVQDARSSSAAVQQLDTHAPVANSVHTAPWAQPQLSPPQLNLDALTNHVIQQLDRRLVAARERLGKT